MKFYFVYFSLLSLSFYFEITVSFSYVSAVLRSAKIVFISFSKGCVGSSLFLFPWFCEGFGLAKISSISTSNGFFIRGSLKYYVSTSHAHSTCCLLNVLSYLDTRE